jgi:ligand-binding sensor protein
MREAGCQGRALVYHCELGLVFWVSPIYSKSELSGFLRGSGYASINIDITAIPSKCNGTIPPQEFAQRISKVPVGDSEKIQSLAEMLLMCAQSLSGDSENCYEILRQRSVQMAAISSRIEELKVKYPEGTRTRNGGL